MECLQEWKEVTPTTRYRDCAEAFYEKDFWKLIEEGERDELFQDFMDEFEKKAKDERRKQRYSLRIAASGVPRSVVTSASSEKFVRPAPPSRRRNDEKQMHSLCHFCFMHAPQVVCTYTLTFTLIKEKGR